MTATEAILSCNSEMLARARSHYQEVNGTGQYKGKQWSKLDEVVQIDLT